MKLTKMLKPLLATAVGVATAAVAPAAAHAATGNHIINNPNGTGAAIGLVRYLDGDYTHGTYDALLRTGQDTSSAPLGWPSVAGFYIGPGYCANLWRNDGPGWVHQGRIGAGLHPIGASTSYDVKTYRC